MANQLFDDELDPRRKLPMFMDAPPEQPQSMVGAPVMAKPSTPGRSLEVPRVGGPDLDKAKDKYNSTVASPTGIAHIRADHPIGGGILRGLEIAGNIMAPRIMAAIPGTEAHKQQQIARAGQNLKMQEEVGKDEAVTQHAAAQTSLAGAQAEALAHKPTPADRHIGSYVNAMGKNVDKFQRMDGTLYEKESGDVNQKDAPSKNIAEQLRQQIHEAYNAGDPAKVAKLQQELKAIDPVGQQRISVTVAGQQAAAQREERKYSRADVRDHDKAYVVPAEAVEKSYQMMKHAYDEYQQAKARGQELPTGAQSMVALSTHLATTFGNVKGARVTKDMIEHHLGARGISDAATVAVQKLTNGDTLSPDQWAAFNDLISQSRKLTWDTAKKQAERKKIPVDFLPEDLGGEAAGSDGAPMEEYVRVNGKLVKK